MKKIYRLQYNTGDLSMVIHDDKTMIYACADLLSKNKVKYPVCVWIIKRKEE